MERQNLIVSGKGSKIIQHVVGSLVLGDSMEGCTDNTVLRR